MPNWGGLLEAWGVQWRRRRMLTSSGSPLLRRRRHFFTSHIHAIGGGAGAGRRHLRRGVRRPALATTMAAVVDGDRGASGRRRRRRRRPARHTCTPGPGLTRTPSSSSSPSGISAAHRRAPSFCLQLHIHFAFPRPCVTRASAVPYTSSHARNATPSSTLTSACLQPSGCEHLLMPPHRLPSSNPPGCLRDASSASVRPCRDFAPFFILVWACSCVPCTHTHTHTPRQAPPASPRHG